MDRIRSILGVGLLLLAGAGSARAENRYYLPHVADGASGGTRYRTTFILFNNTTTDLTAQLRLSAGEKGGPLAVTIPGLGTRSDFSVYLAAGATQMLQTEGAGALVTGAAEVVTPVGIGVSAIFTVYGPGGGFVTEAGVGSSELMSEFLLPVDTTGLFNTGLALYNPGSASAAVTLQLRGLDGTSGGQASLDLAGGAQTARFVAGAGQFFPALGSFQGTVLVRSSVPIAALVLRLNQTPLRYTSLPVVPASSTQRSVNLAQVANGSFGGESYRTSFLLFNLSPANRADVELSLTRDDGSPFVVTIPGRGSRSTFNFTLEPGASAFLPTDGSGPGSTGAATIASSAPIGASAVFTVLNSAGAFEAEAGVGASPVLTAMTLPVDMSGSFNTGVAFYNPEGAGTAVTLRLLDGSGRQLDSPVLVPLGGKGHIAKFVSELFPGRAGLMGSLAVAAPTGVAALTLRLNPSPLSYTTLPVAPGFALGQPAERPLVAKERAGITVAGDLTLDETLESGFRISGLITGAGRPVGITARRADGALFQGELDPETGRYLLSLGPGSYTLRVCFRPSGAAAGGTINWIWSDPAALVVSADATRHITLPSLPLFGVSGAVSGLTGLPGTTDAVVVFVSSDGTVEAEFTLVAGTYQGSLPNGAYRAGVRVPQTFFTTFQNASLNLYNLAAATVNGAPLTVNLAIPATARVSGSVRARWLGQFIFGVTISATDRSAPAEADPACIPPVAGSFANADPTGGQYQMVLARDRSFSLSASVPLLDGSARRGIVYFPVAPDPVTLTGDTNYFFNLPDLPAQATLRGKVTDAQGRGRGGVSVVANSESLTGAAGAGYTAGALTDSQGAYSLTLLAGTAYRLQFIPPGLGIAAAGTCATCPTPAAPPDGGRQVPR